MDCNSDHVQGVVSNRDSLEQTTETDMIDLSLEVEDSTTSGDTESSSSSTLWSCTSSSPSGLSDSSFTDVSIKNQDDSDELLITEKRRRRSGYQHRHREFSSSPVGKDISPSLALASERDILVNILREQKRTMEEYLKLDIKSDIKNLVEDLVEDFLQDDDTDSTQGNLTTNATVESLGSMPEENVMGPWNSTKDISGTIQFKPGTSPDEKDTFLPETSEMFNPEMKHIGYTTPTTIPLHEKDSVIIDPSLTPNRPRIGLTYSPVDSEAFCLDAFVMYKSVEEDNDSEVTDSKAVESFKAHELGIPEITEVIPADDTETRRTCLELKFLSESACKETESTAKEVEPVTQSDTKFDKTVTKTMNLLGSFTSTSSGWSPEYESGLSCPDDIDVVVMDLNQECDHDLVKTESLKNYGSFSDRVCEEQKKIYNWCSEEFVGLSKSDGQKRITDRVELAQDSPESEVKDGKSTAHHRCEDTIFVNETKDVEDGANETIRKIPSNIQKLERDRSSGQVESNKQKILEDSEGQLMKTGLNEPMKVQVRANSLKTKGQDIQSEDRVPGKSPSSSGKLHQVGMQEQQLSMKRVISPKIQSHIAMTEGKADAKEIATKVEKEVTIKSSLSLAEKLQRITPKRIFHSPAKKKQTFQAPENDKEVLRREIKDNMKRRDNLVKELGVQISIIEALLKSIDLRADKKMLIIDDKGRRDMNEQPKDEKHLDSLQNVKENLEKFIKEREKVADKLEKMMSGQVAGDLYAEVEKLKKDYKTLCKSKDELQSLCANFHDVQKMPDRSEFFYIMKEINEKNRAQCELLRDMCLLSPKSEELIHRELSKDVENSAADSLKDLMPYLSDRTEINCAFPEKGLLHIAELRPQLTNYESENETNCQANISPLDKIEKLDKEAEVRKDIIHELKEVTLYSSKSIAVDKTVHLKDYEFLQVTLAEKDTTLGEDKQTEVTAEPKESPSGNFKTLFEQLDSQFTEMRNFGHKMEEKLKNSKLPLGSNDKEMVQNSESDQLSGDCKTLKEVLRKGDSETNNYSDESMEDDELLPLFDEKGLLKNVCWRSTDKTEDRVQCFMAEIEQNLKTLRQENNVMNRKWADVNKKLDNFGQQLNIQKKHVETCVNQITKYLSNILEVILKEGHELLVKSVENAIQLWSKAPCQETYEMCKKLHNFRKGDLSFKEYVYMFQPYNRPLMQVEKKWLEANMTYCNSLRIQKYNSFLEVLDSCVKDMKEYKFKLKQQSGIMDEVTEFLRSVTDKGIKPKNTKQNEKELSLRIHRLSEEQDTKHPLNGGEVKRPNTAAVVCEEIDYSKSNELEAMLLDATFSHKLGKENENTQQKNLSQEIPGKTQQLIVTSCTGNIAQDSSSTPKVLGKVYKSSGTKQINKGTAQTPTTNSSETLKGTPTTRIQQKLTKAQQIPDTKQQSSVEPKFCPTIIQQTPEHLQQNSLTDQQKSPKLQQSAAQRTQRQMFKAMYDRKGLEGVLDEIECDGIVNRSTASGLDNTSISPKQGTKKKELSETTIRQPQLKQQKSTMKKQHPHQRSTSRKQSAVKILQRPRPQTEGVSSQAPRLQQFMLESQRSAKKLPQSPRLQIKTKSEQQPLPTKDQQTSTKAQHPMSKQPIAKVQQPAVRVKQPVTKVHQPTVRVQQPDIKTMKPSTKVQQPASKATKLQASTKVQHAIKQQQSATKAEQFKQVQQLTPLAEQFESNAVQSKGKIQRPVTNAHPIDAVKKPKIQFSPATLTVQQDTPSEDSKEDSTPRSDVPTTGSSPSSCLNESDSSPSGECSWIFPEDGDSSLSIPCSDMDTSFSLIHRSNQSCDLDSSDSEEYQQQRSRPSRRRISRQSPIKNNKGGKIYSRCTSYFHAVHNDLCSDEAKDDSVTTESKTDVTSESLSEFRTPRVNDDHIPSKDNASTRLETSEMATRIGYVPSESECYLTAQEFWEKEFGLDKAQVERAEPLTRTYLPDGTNTQSEIEEYFSSTELCPESECQNLHLGLMSKERLEPPPLRVTLHLSQEQDGPVLTEIVKRKDEKRIGCNENAKEVFDQLQNIDNIDFSTDEDNCAVNASERQHNSRKTFKRTNGQKFAKKAKTPAFVQRPDGSRSKNKTTVEPCRMQSAFAKKPPEIKHRFSTNAEVPSSKIFQSSKSANPAPAAHLKEHKDRTPVPLTKTQTPTRSSGQVKSNKQKILDDSQERLMMALHVQVRANSQKTSIFPASGTQEHGNKTPRMSHVAAKIEKLTQKVDSGIVNKSVVADQGSASNMKTTDKSTKNNAFLNAGRSNVNYTDVKKSSSVESSGPYLESDESANVKNRRDTENRVEKSPTSYSLNSKVKTAEKSVTQSKPQKEKFKFDTQLVNKAMPLDKDFKFGTPVKKKGKKKQGQAKLDGKYNYFCVTNFAVNLPF